MTVEQLAQDPSLQLFAFGVENGGGDLNIVGSAESGYDFSIGIPPMYASRTGKKVRRADINGLGRLISQAGFYNACGGFYTFDKRVSNAIGGYPKGAVLRYLDTSNQLRTVMSMIADNTYDFVESPSYIDGVHWEYVDTVKPRTFRPRVFPDYGKSKKGTLAIGGEYVAGTSELFIIQSGCKDETDIVQGNSPIYIWVNVRPFGAENNNSAGLLSFIPPVHASYALYSKSFQYIDERLEKAAGYTSYYSSSPIQLYLKPGDTVTISANTEYEYSSQYISYPLKSN